jgi:hypothetical protein
MESCVTELANQNADELRGNYIRDPVPVYCLLDCFIRSVGVYTRLY